MNTSESLTREVDDCIRISLASARLGLTQKAIRRKIEDGKWIEGREYHRAPDRCIYIDMRRVRAWVVGEMA